MSAAVSQLGALLDALQNRVAELEKRAGLPVGASAPAGAAAASSGSSSSSADVDQEPTGVTKEFDGLVAKFGTELENVGKTIGGDVDKLVSSRRPLMLGRDTSKEVAESGAVAREVVSAPREREQENERRITLPCCYRPPSLVAGVYLRCSVA